MLVARAELLAAIRAFMARRGVLEVDTPVLAGAPPSEAQLACFDVGPGEGHLVPSPEHAMKRLLAAGSGPIYQLGHVFREGEAGRWHNPEFTMLEWYRPGWTMAQLVDETADFLAAVAGTGRPIRRTFAEVFEQHTGLAAHHATAPRLAAHARNADLAPAYVSASEEQSRTFWLDLIMSVAIAPRLGLDAPLCIEGFPADDAVLVTVRNSEPPVAERFEIYWQGHELANGAQELTDPLQARRRMQREQKLRAAAGLAVPPLDERLLAAMHAGLPTCAGVALGVDRLLAIKEGATELAGVLPFDWSR